jgi:hypothetical protein
MSSPEEVCHDNRFSARKAVILDAADFQDRKKGGKKDGAVHGGERHHR